MKYIKTILGILGVLMLLFVLSGCAQSIAEVKDPEYIGKTVVVKGKVQTSYKIGTLSGYIIKDDSGDSIGVSSSNLPEEGKTVRAKGILMKDTIFGYYIKES